MKTIFFKLIFLIVGIFATTSCTKDDINPNGGGNGGGDGPKTAIAAPKEWDGEKRADITYQVLVYSFADSDGDGIGDFNGITQKLDYIDGLGASGIWLSPIHPASSYHGYDVMDYSKVDPKFGTEADFDNLVKEAEKRGIKIYLDFVINHSSSNHPWFLDAASDENSPYRDYFIFSKDPAADIAAGKIPMIATEGANGYESNQWYAAPNTVVPESERYLFALDWSNSSSPTVTVTKTTKPVDAENTDTSTEGAKYLWLGELYKFYPKGGNKYELVVDFASAWGFLVRTSAAEWDEHKYGAKSSQNNTVTLGVPFKLHSGGDTSDILLPGMDILRYHSHFWTGAFADLNFGDVATSEKSGAFIAICDAAKGWIDRGVDGLRLDAVKHIYHNAKGNENPDFLKKFYDELNGYYKTKGNTEDIYMIGEVLSDYREVAPYYVGLPALFEFSFWWTLESAINNSSGYNFTKDILSYRTLYASHRTDYIDATKLTNHDEDRVGSKLGESVAKCKLAATVLLTSCGSPYIYYGEELGYYGTKANGDEYIRTPMSWGTGNTADKFTDKVDNAMIAALSVSKQETDENSILSVYKQFTELRNNYAALGSGVMTKHEVYNETNQHFKNIAAWYRTEGDQKVLVVHNFAATNSNIVVSQTLKTIIGVNGDIVITDAKAGGHAVQMGGYSTLVLEL